MLNRHDRKYRKKNELVRIIGDDSVLDASGAVDSATAFPIGAIFYSSIDVLADLENRQNLKLCALIWITTENVGFAVRLTALQHR